MAIDVNGTTVKGGILNTGKFFTDSTELVTNLNADRIDSLQGSDLLRSNAADNIEAKLTVTSSGSIDVTNGSISVSNSGKLKIGNFEITASSDKNSIVFTYVG